MRKWVLKVETMKKMKVKTTDTFSSESCATKKFFFSKFMFLLVILVDYF